MRYQYSKEVDCAYIHISDLPYSFTKEIDLSRVVDYAKDSSAIGIELLWVSDGVNVSGLPYETEVRELLQHEGVKII